MYTYNCEQLVSPKNPIKAWNLTIYIKKSEKALNLRIIEKIWNIKQFLYVK